MVVSLPAPAGTAMELRRVPVPRSSGILEPRDRVAGVRRFEFEPVSDDPGRGLTVTKKSQQITSG
jgi:hypothetical protein